MDNKLHCPYCGGLLEVTSHDEDMMEVRMDEQDIEYLVTTVYGHCNACNRKFNWMAEYELELIEVTNFEGID